ncbi:MAG: PrsW family glutamic-type intramembrane protease [bacterium]|nr:PrsW family glutamic-type intramembrane protease [bacterium]
MNEALPIVAALAGGVLPALAWLWFWRREDSRHPEPRRLIALAFLAGMVAVAVVIPVEKFVAPYLTSAQGLLPFILPASTLVFCAWAAIEEICKYLAARFSVLGRRENNEPIDPVIYMVTVALGFAAAENTLFLLSPLSGSSLPQVIQTGDLRFVGATLLHVLASAVIGVAIGLAFYKPKRTRRLYALYGVILAILLHSIFNFLIINTSEDNLLRTFGLVWLGLVALLGMLEFIKRIRPRMS